MRSTRSDNRLRPKAVAKAAVTAAIAPKAKAVAKAKAKAKAMMMRRGQLVPRVRDNYTPVFLELLYRYGYFQASAVRNGRTATSVAAHLFQNCNQRETEFWAGVLWYKCPTDLAVAIKHKWDVFMTKCRQSVYRGVGVTPLGATPAVWAVSRRGAAMGAI